MPMSVENLISQHTLESGTLKTLDPPDDLLQWSCDTIKLGYQIPGLVMALPSLYFCMEQNNFSVEGAPGNKTLLYEMSRKIFF